MGWRRHLVRLGSAACAAVFGFALPPSALAGGDLIIGISQFPGNFNPNINAMAAKTYILHMARRPITVFDADWRLICMLCTELPSLENGRAREETTSEGKSGMAVRYTLKPGLKWGDGQPITTEDVAFTWKVGREPLSGVTVLDFYKRILSVEVHDKRNFTLHLDRRTCDFAEINEFELLPKHLEAEAFAKPAEYRHRSLYETDTANPGLWYGPYRVTDVVSGSRVVLEPNSLWTGTPPHFKRVIVTTISNTASMTSNLLAGGIDYVAGEIGLTLDQAAAFRSRYPNRFKYVFKKSLVYEHIDLNLENPILKDPRVRRALLMAVDRKAISKQLFDGYQPVADSVVNPLDTVYDPDVRKVTYDPSAAGKLLDTAGWKTSESGIRRNAGGKPLRLQLMTTAGNRTRELVEQVLQSQWRDAGFDIRIRNEPARVFFGETVTKRKFPAMAMYAWLTSPAKVPRGQLHSSMIPTAKNGWSGQNYPGIKNTQLDETLDSIETECAPAANKMLWHRLQDLYATHLPALPLYFRAEPHIMPKWLKGVRPTGHQYASTLWIEHWRGNKGGGVK
ncbi:MAG: peptide ABC transporter substrate-binding protein [Rhodospirillaceae bacterium]|nr:peptide ABC transporter substrate-binding protein [Rhodospirillaceae bacterium]